MLGNVTNVQTEQPPLSFHKVRLHGALAKSTLMEMKRNCTNRQERRKVADEGFFFFLNSEAAEDTRWEKAEVDGSSVLSHSSGKDREEGPVASHQSAVVTPFLQPHSSLFVLPLH